MVKFLIILMNGQREILFSTPLLRCLKKQVENSDIQFLTRKQYQAQLESNPYLSKVHVDSGNFRELKARLRNEEFDYIIDLERSLFSVRLKNALHRFSFSINSPGLKEWFNLHFRIKHYVGQHLVNRYLETANVFSVKNDQEGLDMFFPARYKNTLPEELAGISKDFVLVIAEEKTQTQQIPGEKFEFVLSKINTDIVLVGETEINANRDKLVGGINHSRLLNLIGKLDFFQVASLIKQASVVFSTDSELMHLAPALGIPLISVWGSSTPEFGYSPYLPAEGSFMFGLNDLRCRPCSIDGYNACPRKHFKCMMDQDYQKIADTINFLLRRNEE